MAKKNSPPPGVIRPNRLRNTVEGQSLVDIYNLSEYIRDKRMKGHSYRDITKEVNESGLIPNEYKISHNTIARWCRDNGLGGDIADKTEEQAVNVYEQKCKALKLVNSAVDIITVELDELDKQIGKGTLKVGDLTQVITMLDKMTLRQQTLASEIGSLQERIYRYETVEKALNIITDILSVRLDKATYDEIMDAFRESPMLIEALREIAPSNI